jgi:hypothetical protein
MESVDGRTKTAQIVLPRNKVLEGPAEFREKIPGGYFAVNKKPEKLNHGITGYTPKATSRNGAKV